MKILIVGSGHCGCRSTAASMLAAHTFERIAPMLSGARWGRAFVPQYLGGDEGPLKDWLDRQWWPFCDAYDVVQAHNACFMLPLMLEDRDDFKIIYPIRNPYQSVNGLLHHDPAVGPLVNVHPRHPGPADFGEPAIDYFDVVARTAWYWQRVYRSAWEWIREGAPIRFHHVRLSDTQLLFGWLGLEATARPQPGSPSQRPWYQDDFEHLAETVDRYCASLYGEILEEFIL